MCPLFHCPTCESLLYVNLASPYTALSSSSFPPHGFKLQSRILLHFIETNQPTNQPTTKLKARENEGIWPHLHRERIQRELIILEQGFP